MGELHALGVRIFTDDGACVGERRRHAARARVRRRAPGRRRRPARRGPDARRRRATCTKARGRAASASPGRPAAAEAVDRRPRRHARRAHRHARALPPPVDRGRRRPGARREGTGAAGHGRGRAAPLHAHRRRVRGRSTPCSRCTRRCAPTPTSPRSRPGSPTAPSTPSPPTTRRTCPRRRSARSRRRRPGMLGLETALALTLTELVEPGVLALADALALPVVAAGGDRGARRARRADRAGPARQPVRLRPRRAVGGRPEPARQPVAEHAVRRPQAHRPGAPHGAAGRAGRRRRDRAAMSRDAVLVLADGAAFEGEAVGHAPESGVATGEVVFNTALSGYQEILTDPSYAGQMITFTYPHIGNYGVNADDVESRRPFCAGVVVRDLARRPSNWRATDEPRRLPRRHGVPGIAGIDTRRLTRHLRDAGALPGAFGTDEAAVRAAAAAARHAPTASTSSPTVTTDRAVHRRATRTRRSTSSPTTSASSARSCATSSPWAAASRSCRRRRPPPTCSPATPTACSCRTGPATRPRSPARPTPSPASWARCRCSASASATRSSGSRSAHETYKLRFGHHGANHPVRHEATGRVEITSQNHNYAVDARHARAAPPLTHVNLNDGVVEGFRVLDAPAFGVQHHPEAGPGPHDAALPVRRVHRPHGRAPQ